MLRRCSVIIAAFFCVTFAWAASNTQYASFWQPEYHGKRLDYCDLTGKCGQQIANAYCRLMGFEKSVQHIIAYNVGLTHYLASRAQCTGWRCNGFKTIKCSSKISYKPPKTYHYRLRKFVFPRFNHYPVDWCYNGSSGCGHKAAYSFCRRLGFMNVKHFRIAEAIPATQAIGNQKLCFEKQCRGFKEIACFR